MGKKYTVQERAVIVADINKLVSNGMHLAEAVKAAKITLSSYYIWRKSLGRKQVKRSYTRKKLEARRPVAKGFSRSVVESILTDPNLNDGQRVKMLVAYAQA